MRNIWGTDVNRKSMYGLLCDFKIEKKEDIFNVALSEVMKHIFCTLGGRGTHITIPFVTFQVLQEKRELV